MEPVKESITGKGITLVGGGEKTGKGGVNQVECSALNIKLN